MYNILIIIILLIIFYIFIKIEEKFTLNLYETEIDGKYHEYIKGKKVYPLFTDKFREKVRLGDINDLDIDQLSLYYLVDEISNLDGFDIKKSLELVTPYKRFGLNTRWGIFSTLNIYQAMKQLKRKRDKLNSKQLISVSEYINNGDVKDTIKYIIRQKSNIMYGCKENVKKFLKDELKKDNIDVNFYNSERININLSNYSKKELGLIKDLLEWVPDNLCVLMNTIFEIDNHKSISKKVLNSCQNKAKDYIDKYLNSKGIKFDNNFKDFTLTELLIIKDVYKYLINCDNLDYVNPKKIFTKNKNDYIKNLIKNINLTKTSLNQISSCPIKVKEYLQNKYLENNIPINKLQQFPEDDINEISANNLEFINELYINLPKCEDFKKQAMKEQIIEIISYLELISGNSYGCRQDINMYLKNELSKKNIDSEEFSEIKIDLLSFEELEYIFNIYKHIPPCKDLDLGEKSEYEKKSEKYFSILKNKNEAPERVLNKSHDISNKSFKDYHPYLGTHEKLKDDEFFTTKEVFKEAELNFDKYMYSDLFKIPSCEAKSILESQCPKNDKSKIDNNEHIIQSENDGISSIYSPKLYINIPRDKGYRVSLK